MKRSKFTEEQIIGILREQEAGAKTAARDQQRDVLRLEGQVRGTKEALSQKSARLMVFTLVQAAAKKWRRIKGANQLPRIIEGISLTGGVVNADDAQTRAA